MSFRLCERYYSAFLQIQVSLYISVNYWESGVDIFDYLCEDYVIFILLTMTAFASACVGSLLLGTWTIMLKLWLINQFIFMGKWPLSH